MANYTTLHIVWGQFQIKPQIFKSFNQNPKFLKPFQFHPSKESLLTKTNKKSSKFRIRLFRAVKDPTHEHHVVFITKKTSKTSHLQQIVFMFQYFLTLFCKRFRCQNAIYVVHIYMNYNFYEFPILFVNNNSLKGRVEMFQKVNGFNLTFFRI